MATEETVPPVAQESQKEETKNEDTPVEETKSALDMLAQGKRNVICGEIPLAVNQFQEACALLAKQYGETAPECAEAYFCYGQSLLDLARMETGVLGNALQGVDVEEEAEVEEKEPESEQFEKADNLKGEERDKLRQEVYEAMSEEAKLSAQKEGAGGEKGMEVEMADDKKENESKESKIDKSESEKEVSEKDSNVLKEKKDNVEIKETVEKDSVKDEGSDKKADKESDKVKENGEGKENSESMDTDNVKDGSKENKENANEKSKEESKENEGKTESKEMETTETKDEKKTEGKDSEVKSEKDAATVDKKETAEESKDSEMKDDESKESEKKEDSGSKVDKSKENAEEKEKPETKDAKSGEDETGKESKGSQATTDTKDAETQNNGDEAMETEEKEGESSKEGEEEEAEEAEEEEGETTSDEKQGEEDADDVSNLQLAWEMLELAKMIYLKDSSKESQLKAAQAYLKLGEVSLETEQYEQATEDFKACLDIQKSHLEAADRLLAETHYQLGLACSFDKKFDPSIEHYRAAIKVIEDKICELEKVIEEKSSGKGKELASADDPVTQATQEIKELKEILPDISSKIEDAEEEKKNLEQLKNMTKEIVSETLTTFSSSTETAPEAKPIEVKKASDISHLIRRKRKPDDDAEDPECKKSRQEDGAGDAPITNGHSKTEDAKQENGNAEPEAMAT